MNMTARMLLATGLLLLSLSTSAHELLTATLTLDESANGRVTATLKTPLGRSGEVVALAPQFDSRCEINGTPEAEREINHVIRQWSLHCKTGLSDFQLRFEGLDPRMPEALVMARFANGNTQVTSVDRHDPALTLQSNLPQTDTVELRHYLLIGIEHILRGADHLLFVLGLMLVVAAYRSRLGTLVMSLTAFTVAHSLTLALSMFGIWGLPPKPVEIMIALSIVLLAAELLHHRLRTQKSLPPTLTLRKPWLVAFLFGLLHGFGFAGALAQIGLPENARGSALLLFNIGVEIGQLLFVGALLLILTIAKRTRSVLNWPTPALAWLLGVVAVYWTLDRTASWLSASRWFI